MLLDWSASKQKKALLLLCFLDPDGIFDVSFSTSS
jgi:hypothetical protein